MQENACLFWPFREEKEGSGLSQVPEAEEEEERTGQGEEEGWISSLNC